MNSDLEPLSTDPNAWVFVDVETRSHEDVTVHGAYRKPRRDHDLYTPDEWFKLYEFDPVTGFFYWKKREIGLTFGGHAPAPRYIRAFNTRYAGVRADSKTPYGYRCLQPFYANIQAHRLAWAWKHRAWPDGEIDHINGIRDDNRLENLRAVTPRENRRNSALRSDNTSGRVGVIYDSVRQRWRAEICIEGKNIYLGRYTSYDAACAARDDAEKRFNFHPNHGRIAP